jgi:hypothetical protein
MKIARVSISASVGLFAAGSLVAACGGETPLAKEPENTMVASAPSRPSKQSGMRVSTELGEIDQADTEKTFRSLQPQLALCFKNGRARVDYLGGDLSFFLRVGADGRAKYAYLEDSSLGDRETERCMLHVISRAVWPAPNGGEAEVRKKVGFDPPGDVRAPASWSSDRVAATLGKSGDKAEACKRGASGTFRVTAYVEPDGNNGRAHAVGVAVPNKDGDDKADCIVEAVKSMKMPSPGSYAAKVSFTL